MKVALKRAHLVVGTGETIDNGTAIIDGDRIGATYGESDIDKDVEHIIDLEGRTIIPGLIDAHIHMIGGDKTVGFDDEPPTMKIGLPFTAKALLQGVAAARTTLRSGFTTVREVGGRDYLDVALRDAQRGGLIDGPRMLASGPGVWPTGGSGAHLEEAVGVDDTSSAVRRVRQLVSRGVDVIKIVSVDTLESLGATSTVFPTPEEIEAVFAEATRNGMLKAAHAMGSEAIDVVVRAGADTVEHGWYLTEENCRTLNGHAAYLIPTLSNVAAIAHRGSSVGMPWADLLAQEEPAIMDRFRMAIEARVKIAVGTDVGGNAAHAYGNSAMELEAYAACGMSPLDALSAATLAAARAIRLDKTIGSIERGKLADLVVVDGDPLSDISLTRTGVVAVMQGGIVYRDDLGLFDELRVSSRRPRHRALAASAVESAPGV